MYFYFIIDIKENFEYCTVRCAGEHYSYNTLLPIITLIYTAITKPENNG